MTLVVDASVVLRWFVAELGSVAALGIMERGTLMAPDIMPTEVRDCLHRAAADEQVAASLPQDFERVLPTLALDIVPSVHYLTRAFQLSMMVSQPIYACVYLAVAEANHTTLVTADADFVEAVRRISRVTTPLLLLERDGVAA